MPQVNVLKGLRTSLASSGRDIETFVKRQKDKREKGNKKDKRAEAKKELKNARGVSTGLQSGPGLLDVDWNSMQDDFVAVEVVCGEPDATKPYVRPGNVITDFCDQSSEFQEYLQRFLQQASAMLQHSEKSPSSEDCTWGAAVGSYVV